MKLFNKVFGSANERELKRLWPVVEQINSLEAKFEALSDEELQGQTALFRARFEGGESLDDILPEAFAVVREASKRTLGMRHFDVQLIGGIVLHQGKIAEMKTGEGKTLCSTLPAYLNGLTGRGVHIVTVNDYLARRDAEWMGKVYAFLGLSTGVVLGGMNSYERKEAYGADITYGQNNEFGFDYLRDNMKFELAEKCQREFAFAIVDEVDSILIDEARTPLIISGPAEKATELYHVADQIVRRLSPSDYTIDIKGRQVALTEDGVASVESLLNVDNLYDPRHIDLVHHVNQSLSAHLTKERDKDYVVQSGEVIIVDEFTGRLMPGRRWSDGLHQAVEAKEKVAVQSENQTLATITFQNYFRMYKKLAGMTGTADTEAEEFGKIYKLSVVVIPTNKQIARLDYPDVVFSTEEGKTKAIIAEIKELHEKGQPILVGTASIDHSERLSARLKKHAIPHHVLNAKQHEREADIVAQAGRYGAVTISTNMAGRGTDIILGGNPEFLAAEEAGTRDPEDPEFQAQLEHFKQACAEERQRVLDAGGLHILGTERHESRRIDNQLRGRAGRQGDIGSSRFYISLEDDLMRRFGGERIQAIMARVGMREDDAIEGRLIGHSIESAQKKVEGIHFDQRKYLLDYDNVLNKQREVVYTLRNKILESQGIENDMREMIADVVEDIVLLRANEKEAVVNWDVPGMFAEFKRLFTVELAATEFTERQQFASKELAQDIFDTLKDAALTDYEARKGRFGEENFLMLQRLTMLGAIDHYWKEHLSNMDHLKEGIYLRGYGQQNPLHVYQRESYHLFTAMMMTISTAVIQHVFAAEPMTEEQLAQLEAAEREEARKREEGAHARHEDVIDSAGEKHASTDGQEGNRKQRRRQAQAASHYEAKPEDHLPPADSSAGKKKNTQRKKNKQARKQRRRSR